MADKSPPLKPITPIRDDPDYQRIWRRVDGALRKAMHAHPECFVFGPGLSHCRESLIKRITGDLLSLLAEASKDEPSER